MQVLELLFNPKTEQGILLDSFCFQPKDRDEIALGNLYLIGQLRNTLPLVQKNNLLQTLAEKIKNSYYQDIDDIADGPEQSFSQALSSANQFLSQSAREQNNSFLGNLDFAAVSVSDDLSANLSRTGRLKMLFIKKNEIFDLSDNFFPIANQFFPNSIKGQLENKDKLVILSDDLFEVFKQMEIFKELIAINKVKQAKLIFKRNKDILQELSGICLIVFIKKQRIQWKKALFAILILAAVLILGWLKFS